MATADWYVNEISNSAGVYTRIWVTHGMTANSFIGPYATEPEAKTAAQGLLGTASLTGWEGDVAVLGGALGAAASIATSGSPSANSISQGETDAENAIPGLAQIGDFFGALAQGSTWIRVGEVLLGLILVAVGVARVTHALPAATKIAKTVGAVGLA